MRRAALFALLVTLSLSAQTASRSAKPDPAAIHRSAIVVDTHADTTQWLLLDGFDLAAPSDRHLTLDKARAGNLGAEFFSIWVEQDEYKDWAHGALRQIDAVHRAVEKHPDRMVLASTADDIVRARTGPRKRLAVLMGVEGGHMIENDLAILRDFYRLGVRYMTLTHSETNDWADSSGDINDEKVKHHRGLTDFGVEVVREMNRLGMMVDISHVSDRAFYKTLVVARAPVIASHSGSRALTAHDRNMTDDMLRALARNGGVCMVNFYSAFVDEDYRKAAAATRAERRAKVEAFKEQYRKEHGVKDVPYSVVGEYIWKLSADIPRPPFKSLIDHIDHIAKVAGVDHVGLGSDFDGVDSLPQGLDSAADLPKITAALVERGYNREQIHKILGGNILRVMHEVERTARQLQKEPPLGKEPLGEGENK